MSFHQRMGCSFDYVILKISNVKRDGQKYKNKKRDGQSVQYLISDCVKLPESSDINCSLYKCPEFLICLVHRAASLVSKESPSIVGWLSAIISLGLGFFKFCHYVLDFL